MKYIVILGDGMADQSNDKLGGKTPLDVAIKPNIDYCAQKGRCGMVQTIPSGMKPGSDVANLSVLGYDIRECYTGRAPLEALHMGLTFQEGDMAIRCNLVTLSDDKRWDNKVMLDYSAGEISDYEAHELMAVVQKELGNHNFSFHAGISYRHCMMSHISKQAFNELTPPHDITDKKIGDYMPHDNLLFDLVKRSYEILSAHPINKARIRAGKNPANAIWLWGAGTKPQLESFESMFNLKGAVISAVDLLNGIAIGTGMGAIKVYGATGKLDTNYEGKAKACIKALTKGGYDYVYLHVEAPDECGHQGDVDGKVEAIQRIDRDVVGYIRSHMGNEDYTLLIMPDHATPLATKTHTCDPVPYIIYRSNNETSSSGVESYTEATCNATGNKYDSCESLVKDFLFSNLMFNSYDQSDATTVAGAAETEVAVAITESAIANSNADGVASDSEIVPIDVGNETSTENESGEFILPSVITELDDVVEDNGLFDDGFVDPETAAEVAVTNGEVAADTSNESDKAKIKTMKQKKTPAPKPKKTTDSKPETTTDSKPETTTDSKSKKTLTKEDKKKRIIIYIVVAILAVAILITSIVTPIVVLNKDKIFISNASDFSNVDKGNYYVLKKDVTIEGPLTLSNPYSIDLQGHILKVTGKLTFNHTQSKELNIGTKKKKDYVSGGLIDAGEVIFACAGTLNVTANIKAKTMSITNVDAANFAQPVAITDSMTIDSGDVSFRENVVFGSEGEMVIGTPAVTTVAQVNDKAASLSVSLHANAITDITFNGYADRKNNFLMSTRSNINSLTMNEFVEARIHGKVATKVVGGDKVIMTEKSAAMSVTGMRELWISSHDNIGEIIMPNGVEVNYIVYLETPQDINVQLTENAEIICSVTKVNKAQRYSFKVGDKEIVVPATDGAFGTINADVTSLVKDAGDHKIYVTALGAEDADPDLINASKATFINYKHMVKLETPQGVTVSSNDTGITLEWNTVRFADEYEVVINGTSITTREAAVGGKHSLKITEQLSKVGVYSIRIMARNAKNPAVQSSDMAMTSYQIYKSHNAVVTLTHEIKEDRLLLNWNSVDTAKSYTLYKRATDGTITKVILSANSYSVDIKAVTSGDVYYVKANAIGYYLDTAISAEVIVTKPQAI